MSSTWKRNLSLSLFGESHGTAIGVVIDNLPAGETIDMDALRFFWLVGRPEKICFPHNAGKKTFLKFFPD